jgi:hypothetical protein
MILWYLIFEKDRIEFSCFLFFVFIKTSGNELVEPSFNEEQILDDVCRECKLCKYKQKIK